MPLKATYVYDSYHKRNTWCVPMTPVVEMFAWIEAHAAEGFAISGVYGNFDHWNKARAGDHTNRTTHDLWGALPAVTGTDNVTRRFVSAIDYKLPSTWMGRYETWCVAELRAKRAPWVKYMNINGHHYHRESNYAQGTSGDFHVHESFAPGYESKTVPGLLLLRFYAEVMHPEGDDDMDGTTYIRGSAEVAVPGGTGDFSSFNKPFGWWLSAMYAHILGTEMVVKTVAAGVASIDALDDEAKAAIDAASATLEEIRRRLEEEGQEPVPAELVLGPPLYGVDLNAWRGDVDWPAVAAWRNGDHRVAFATLKASHGAADAPPGVDAHWAREAPEMAASGIPLVGGCHRLTLDAPVADQVSKFLSAMDVIGGYAGRLVQLDCEAANSATTRAFMAEWNTRTDHYPVLGYLPDWREAQWLDTDSDLPDYGFAGWWASEYVDGQGDPIGLATLITPEHWHAHDGVEPTILQYSSKGVVPGVEGTCDVNLFRGTLAELRELATRPGDA